MLDTITKETKSQFPSFSIVIEWENARLSELHNTREMLAELRRQLTELAPSLAGPAEIIFVYQPDRIAETLITDVAGVVFPAGGPLAEIRMIPAPERRYYEMKNDGALQATGEIVVFLDSDVVPEPGWLAAILRSFDDPKIVSVQGNTYVPPETTYSRAFALFWMFPLRAADGPVVSSVSGYANNIAFRRELFPNENGFPDLPHYRWHAGVLLRSLAARQHRLIHQPLARVQHPPPNSVHHFVSRALCEGHDKFLVSVVGGERTGLLRGAYWYYRGSLENVFTGIRNYGEDVGLGPIGRFGAAIVGITFSTVGLVGFFLARFAPGVIRHYFAV